MKQCGAVRQGTSFALRASDNKQAAQWRHQLRGILEPALASGHVADGVTRSGWYRLSKTDQA